VGLTTRVLGRVIRLTHWLMRSRAVRWGTPVFVAVSLALVFGYASDTMYGIEHGANRIAYWHIGMAWVGAVALSTTFLGSLLHLRFRGRFWNRLAHSAGEVGFVFVTLTLVTGSIWGKVIWNSWWEWSDVRLVTFLILWFVYAGYLTLSASSEEGLEGTYTAVYGVVGFVTVPLSYVSTRLWIPTFHETTLGNPDVSANIDPFVLVVSLVAATFLYVYLMGLRIELHSLEADHRARRASRRR
jgi:heme exporter protein C